jgi:hypothetical protein
MANTFELIASSTVGSGGAANITFSAIPSTFTDLCVKFSLRKAVDGNDTLITFNGSSANISSRLLYGTGSAAGSGADASNFYSLADRSSYTANTFSNGEFYIPNYASTSTYKSITHDAVTENNGTESLAYLTAALLSSNSAISSITIAASSGNLVQYSTAYLYGVKNA